jgi:hypothetical protein
LLQVTKDPQPWKEDPSELPEQVLRFRQVNQQVQQSVQQLQVIQPQQVIQPEAKEVGEIVQRPNESNASTNTQPVLKTHPQPKGKKPVQVRRPTGVSKIQGTANSSRVLQPELVPQSAVPIPVFAPEVHTITTADPAANIQKPEVPLGPAEEPAQLANQQPMEEDWEGRRGARDVEMNQEEDEWERFGEQNNGE